MATYQIDGRLMHEDEPDFQSALQALHSLHKRPRCACCEKLPEMYVARINGHYIIKRMPNSAIEHSPDCDSYELPPEVSGLARSLGAAIREDMETGLMDVRVEFSLSAKSGVAPAKNAPTVKPTVTAKPQRLSLLGVLHFLWEQSRLNKWVPKMAGKRSWGVVQRCLMQCAAQVQMKGHQLGSILIVPEKSAYSRDGRSDIHTRYLEKLKQIEGDKLSGIALVVGEFQCFKQSKFSHRMELVGHTGPGIYLTAQHLAATLKRFAEVEQLANSIEGGRLIVVATGAVSRTHTINVREIAMMAVSKDYLPVESFEDWRLITYLQGEGKWFTKTMRYDLHPHIPLASAVMTEKAQVPLAMYIVPANSSDTFCAGVDELVTQSGLRAWVWDCGRENRVPPIGQSYSTPIPHASSTDKEYVDDASQESAAPVENPQQSNVMDICHG